VSSMMDPSSKYCAAPALPDLEELSVFLVSPCSLPQTLACADLHDLQQTCNGFWSPRRAFATAVSAAGQGATASTTPLSGEVAVGCLVAYQRERDTHASLALVQGRHGKRGWTALSARCAFRKGHIMQTSTRKLVLKAFSECTRQAWLVRPQRQVHFDKGRFIAYREFTYRP